MPTRFVSSPIPAIAVSLAFAALGACKKDNAKPKPTPADAAAVAVARPADAAPTPGPAADAGAAAASADAGAGGKTTPPDPAGAKPKPKNLKVMPKTLTGEQIDGIMKTISKSLGVKCDFCHEKDDFASDKNEHKGEARKMMTMTTDLNKQFFGGKYEVTCVTCHRGKEKPE